MSRSDILEEYAKIAAEQGIISLSYPNNDEYIKKLEKNDGRAGSDDLDTIEMLYGVKPNGKDDEVSIVEKAHPNTTVISESYDRFDGVVENLQERSNVMQDIATKPANGNYHTGRRVKLEEKYLKSKTALLDNLVRLGFLMDSANNEKLTKLADVCAETLTKEAWELSDLFRGSGPLAGAATGAATGAGLGAAFIPGVGAVPGAIIGGLVGLLGSTALVNNISPADQGVIANTENAVKQLEEARGTDPNIDPVIPSLVSALQKFQPLAQQVEDMQVIKVDDVQDLMKVKNDPEDAKKIETINRFVSQCRFLQQALPKQIAILRAAKPKQFNLPKGLDYLGKVVDAVWTPAIKDAYLALETLYESLNNTITHAQQLLGQAQTHVESLVEQLDEAGKNPPSETRQVAPKREEQSFDELMRGLTG